MVDIGIQKQLREHYEKSLEKYVKEHPGEYVLLVGPDVKESFYKTWGEVNGIVAEEYGDRLGPTILVERIPRHITSKPENKFVGLVKKLFEPLLEK